MNQTQTNEAPYFMAYHAFIVGINNYTIVSPLHTAINDSQKLSSLLEEKYDYQTHLCTNPTGKDLIAYLEGMTTRIEEKDCVLFYFAGHGIASDSDKGLKGFIVPTDGDMSHEESLISMSFLLSTFSKLRCKHFLLILDCCFAGAFRWAEKYRDTARYEDILFQQHYYYYIQNPSWQVLTSTSHTQKALDSIFGTRETIEAQHSPFSACLINGLKGAADRNEDKIITTAELYSYLQERLTTITGNQGNLQNVGFFPLEMHGNGEFMFIPKDFDPSKLTVKNYENPYMGLQAYSDEEKDLFFGRKKAIEELLVKTFENTLTVVVGASGTGKSSLVKAGILPVLKQKGLKYQEMRPSKDPLAELTNLKNDFEVLVIDQFEELITQSEQDSASKFIGILREWVQLKEKRIIITIRIDFEPQIDKTGIEAAWKVGRFLIPPFTPEELREVIITPAARVGRFIEPITLVDDIISEVVHYSGSLPLLSFTMSELFQQCKENPYRHIRQIDYEALGGVTGSLQKSADNIVSGLNEAEQRTLKYIMLRMVSFSGGEIAGKRVMLKDLEFSNVLENKNVTSILDKLTEARLIVRNTDTHDHPYIEPAHDALIKTWSTLYVWIKKFREENIYLLNKLAFAVNEYYQFNDDSYLWHNNPSLKQIFELEEDNKNLLNRVELAFINKSKHKELNELKALREERDEAIRRKLVAEKSVRSEQNTTLVNRMQESDITLAMRTIQYNAYRHPDNNFFHEAYHKILTNNQYVFVSQILREEADIVALSPDGKKILIAGYFDRTVKIWNLETEKIDKVFEGHKSSVYAIAFSPDGTKILTGSFETAILWNVETAEIECEFIGHEHIIDSVAFSPDGTKILTGSSDKTAKLWDIRNSSVIKTFKYHEDVIRDVAFSLDGKEIVTCGRDEKAIIWNIKNARIKYVFGNAAPITSVVFSPSTRKRMILTGDADGTVNLWDIKTSKSSIAVWYDLVRSLGWRKAFFAWRKFNLDPKQVFKGHKKAISKVRYSSNHWEILTASEDGTVKLWYTGDAQVKKLFIGHRNGVNTFDVSDDGEVLVTGGADKEIKIWEPIISWDQRTLSGHLESICYVTFSPDGKTAISCSLDRTARLWDIKRGKTKQLFGVEQAKIFEKLTPSIVSAAFSPDGKKVLIGGGNMIATLWDIETAEIDFSFVGEYNDFLAMAFSPDGKKILTGGQVKKVKIWDIETRQVEQTFLGHFDYIRSVAFSPDGQFVLTGGNDKTVKLWDVKEKKARLTFDEHDGAILAIAFSPNGTKALTAGEDKKAIVWDIKKGKVEHILTGHIGYILAVAFSLDGRYALTASKDKTIKKWDLETQTYQTYIVNTEYVRSACFYPESELALIGGYKETILFHIKGETVEDLAYKYSLVELHNEGVKLEPEDLFILWERGEKLSSEELRLIGNKKNKIE